MENSNLRSGQVLLEIIIAGVIIIFIALAVVQGISSSLRGIDQTSAKTVGVFLSRELVEAARAIAMENWRNVADIATSSEVVASDYFATTSASKWVTSTGTEIIALNAINYTRSFRVYDVNRATSTSNIVSSGGFKDPSTIKLTTFINWTDLAGRNDVFSQTVYFSRYTNDVFPQTQWLNRTGDVVVTSTYPTTFSTSSNVATTTDGFLLNTQ